MNQAKAFIYSFCYKLFIMWIFNSKKHFPNLTYDRNGTKNNAFDLDSSKEQYIDMSKNTSVYPWAFTYKEVYMCYKYKHYTKWLNIKKKLYYKLFYPSNIAKYLEKCIL